MYNIKLYDYVPRPDPANSDRIVAAHYYPSWTRGGNTLTREFEELADYPDRTPLMGYYEDKNPEVIDWEIKWALEHGINCFIYCWYRWKDNVGKPVTRDGLRLSCGLHDGLFGSRYGEMMNFAIMYETDSRWGAADEADLLNNLLPFWNENYFSRPNYLKLDNKPVVFLYDPALQLRNSLGGARGMKVVLDAAREKAKEYGFDGLYFAEELYGFDEKDGFEKSASERGVDASFRYNIWINGTVTDQDKIFRAQYDYNREHIEQAPECYIPAVSQFWDPEPRLYRMSYKNMYWYAEYDTYRRLLREVKALTDKLPENTIARRMLMVDNCNEWDEGHFLFPSYRFGFKYLQCIREELTDHANLPDYRMPESLGFGRYDEAWNDGGLDLSAHNDHKLDGGDFVLHRYEHPEKIK